MLLSKHMSIGTSLSKEFTSSIFRDFQSVPLYQPTYNNKDNAIRQQYCKNIKSTVARKSSLRHFNL
jgi:hypothetical protein